MSVILSTMPNSANSTVVIGITGMPGARKTEVAKMLSRYGIQYFTLSRTLRQELENHQIDLTPANFADVALRLREKYGQDFLARKAWEALDPKETVIIDGIRSPKEVDFFRSVSDFFFSLLVHASPETRLARFKLSKNPLLSTRSQFEAQERNNLDLGIGEVTAEADYVIINEEYCSKSLEEQVDAFYQFLKKKLPKLEELKGKPV